MKETGSEAAVVTARSGRTSRTADGLFGKFGVYMATGVLAFGLAGTFVLSRTGAFQSLGDIFHPAPAAAAESAKDEDDDAEPSPPVKSVRRKTMARNPVQPQLVAASEPPPVPAPPVARVNDVPPPPKPSVQPRRGMSKADLIAAIGEPDMKASTMQDSHVVEQYSYAARPGKPGLFVLLCDGQVSSVARDASE
jgi:hypothetical protein